jgi:hypothetical protein
LNTKGRLIYPSELILDFKDGVYAERSGIAAELEYKAPLQAEILKLLEGKEFKVSDMAKSLVVQIRKSVALVKSYLTRVELHETIAHCRTG